MQFKGLPCDDSGQITAQGLEFLQMGASLRAFERLAPSGASEALPGGVNPTGSGESQQRPLMGELKRDECLQECLWRCEEVLTQLQRQHHHLSPACQTRVLSLAPSELEHELEREELMRLRLPHFFCADLDASMSVSESHAADADRLQVSVRVTVARSTTLCFETVGTMLLHRRVDRILSPLSLSLSLSFARSLLLLPSRVLCLSRARCLSLPPSLCLFVSFSLSLSLSVSLSCCVCVCVYVSV